MVQINLQISDELRRKLNTKIKETEFKSLEEYIIYVLEQVVSGVNNTNSEKAYTDEEEEAMRERLKEMGYV